MTKLAVANGQMDTAIESVLMQGDLKQLTSDQRVAYYRRVCDSVGLNPLTQPFQYLTLNGQLKLYALKSCTEQLRKIHNISLKITARENHGGCYVVTASASMPDGRCDESTGAVHIDGLKGENLANALMKAETKAKRRVTLSICGLSILDESELETVRGAQVVNPDATPAVLKGAPRKTLADLKAEPIDVPSEDLTPQLEASLRLVEAKKAEQQSANLPGSDLEYPMEPGSYDEPDEPEPWDEHGEVPTFPRGKHQGKTPFDVPSGYCQWYADNVKDGPPELLKAVKARLAKER